MSVFQKLPSSAVASALLRDLLQEEQELANFFNEDRIFHFTVDPSCQDWLREQRSSASTVWNSGEIETCQFIDVVYNASDASLKQDLLLGNHHHIQHWLVFRTLIENQEMKNQGWQLHTTTPDTSANHTGLMWTSLLDLTQIKEVILHQFPDTTRPSSSSSLFEICHPLSGYQTTRYFLTSDLWIDFSSWMNFGSFGCYAVGGCRLVPGGNIAANPFPWTLLDWMVTPALNTLMLCSLRTFSRHLMADLDLLFHLGQEFDGLRTSISQLFQQAPVSSTLSTDSSFYVLHPHNEEDMWRSMFEEDDDEEKDQSL